MKIFKRILCFFVIVLLFSGIGCQVHRPFFKKHKTVSVETSTPMSKLERAMLLQNSGDYLSAVIAYREVISHSRNKNEIDSAKIGAAECLISLKKFPAALEILEPLSLDIVTEINMKKLALAGEILLHIGRYKEAEMYLEFSVGSLDLESLLDQVHFGSNPNPNPHSNSDTVFEPDSWIPAAIANLGCAYLKNDKPEYAMPMYQFASCLYRRSGNQVLAERSQRMYDDLVSVMRQYAPFKPVPVAKGFSPGRM
ncbi:MAG: tetratricopeptide repeat protein [Planctomycetaceae bacterium]|jgi:tetratricopeptide (TPR) repeat protein|nr:tetratricopeptide repeat protein [Planctomycetaceae bacterium]